jgi:AraC-like DNA-binding protein
VLNEAVDIEDFLEPGIAASNVIIRIRKDILFSLAEFNHNNEEFISFLSDSNSPFLYQENISFEMNSIIIDLAKKTDYGKLEKLYYKTKAMELLYHFFTLFSKRKTYNAIPINNADIERILRIEKMILKDLSIPPVLSKLACAIGMSETKMKLLFKKIFGDSIYNYYSSARMIEAASLLKNNKNLSVSDVGYSLGFSNLSHFSNLFRRHIGMNPKEYVMGINKYKPETM